MKMTLARVLAIWAIVPCLFALYPCEASIVRHAAKASSSTADVQRDSDEDEELALSGVDPVPMPSKFISEVKTLMNTTQKRVKGAQVVQETATDKLARPNKMAEILTKKLKGVQNYSIGDNPMELDKMTKVPKVRKSNRCICTPMTLERLKATTWTKQMLRLGSKFKTWIGILKKARQQTKEELKKSWAEKKSKFWKKQGVGNYIPKIAKISLYKKKSAEWEKIEMGKEKSNLEDMTKAKEAFKVKWASFSGWWADYKKKFDNAATRDKKRVKKFRFLSQWLDKLIKDKWKSKVAQMEVMRKEYHRLNALRLAYTQYKEAYFTKNLGKLSQVLNKINERRKKCECMKNFWKKEDL
eukprot:TRINITY_DN111_c0_g1_i1.p1 TRINITY_DN111_c0_g1~~TRINITY_DN111_c0_g1_i1.p1  ORF type:complete len:355 (-),score=60.22 TRINITY_DN111_c0_g1_i1:67-1131(-)